jgi:hypothetical protein
MDDEKNFEEDRTGRKAKGCGKLVDDRGQYKCRFGVCDVILKEYQIEKHREYHMINLLAELKRVGDKYHTAQKIEHLYLKSPNVFDNLTVLELLIDRFFESLRYSFSFCEDLERILTSVCVTVTTERK